MTKEYSIRGVALPSSSKEEFQQFAAAFQDGMEIGWLRPVIGLWYSLAQAAQAHEDIIHSSGATGKMILLSKSLILPLISCVMRGFLPQF